MEMMEVDSSYMRKNFGGDECMEMTVHEKKREDGRVPKIKEDFEMDFGRKINEGGVERTMRDGGGFQKGNGNGYWWGLWRERFSFIYRT